MKKIFSTKTAIGFFAISISYLVSSWIYFISLEMLNPEIVLYLFPIGGAISFVAWSLIHFLVLNRLRPDSRLLKPFALAFVGGIYGCMMLMLYGFIIDEMFDAFSDTPLALMTGFIFGLIYSLLVKSDKIRSLLSTRPGLKLISILAPGALLAIIFWILPIVTPRTLYPYMTHEMQDKIFYNTLSQFKVGDDIRSLQEALPEPILDYFVDSRGDGGMRSSGGLYDYEIEIKKYKITRFDMYPQGSIH